MDDEMMEEILNHMKIHQFHTLILVKTLFYFAVELQRDY